MLPIEKEGPVIDTVLYLQNYAEGWSSGNFEYKHDYRDCIDPPRYHKTPEGDFRGWFWSYSEMRAKSFDCMSVQGPTHVVKDLVLKDLAVSKAIMFDRGENLLHDHFGDVSYWNVRKAMRFAGHLVEIADEFRQRKFGSNDEADDTVKDPLWEEYQVRKQAEHNE